jgi:hypothetical protein
VDVRPTTETAARLKALGARKPRTAAGLKLSLEIATRFHGATWTSDPDTPGSDDCDRSIESRSFSPASRSRALILPARLSTSSGSERRAAPPHGDIRPTRIDRIADHHVRLTQDGAAGSADRHQSDAVSVVAAVAHSQISTDATCPGQLRRLCHRLGLADRLSRQRQQERGFGPDAQSHSSCRYLHHGVSEQMVRRMADRAMPPFGRLELAPPPLPLATAAEASKRWQRGRSAQLGGRRRAATSRPAIIAACAASSRLCSGPPG